MRIKSVKWRVQILTSTVSKTMYLRNISLLNILLLYILFDVAVMTYVGGNDGGLWLVNHSYIVFSP
jgi:hypothetical protein